MKPSATAATAGRTRRAAARSPSALVRQQLADAQARLAAGKTLPNHLARVVRDSWLLDLRAEVWAGSAEAAADLAVSPSTLSTWAGQGAPIPAHSPIPKVALLRWLYDQAAQRRTTTDPAASVESRLAEAKLARLTGDLEARAEDRARTVAVEIIQAARTALTTSLPPALVAALTAEIETGADQVALESTVARLIEGALRQARSTITTHPAGQPASPTA